ncbi:MAG: hypothetical protein U0694_16070 [Anaerolineae bacterium]
MRKSDERLLAAARKGFLAGARDIIFHPGSYHSQPREQVYERAKQKLLEITGILRSEGVDVPLRPETMGKSAMFGNLDEVLQLSKEVPGIAPCIDPRTCTRGVAMARSTATPNSLTRWNELKPRWRTGQRTCTST